MSLLCKGLTWLLVIMIVRATASDQISASKALSYSTTKGALYNFPATVSCDIRGKSFTLNEKQLVTLVPSAVDGPQNKKQFVIPRQGVMGIIFPQTVFIFFEEVITSGDFLTYSFTSAQPAEEKVRDIEADNGLNRSLTGAQAECSWESHSKGFQYEASANHSFPASVSCNGQTYSHANLAASVRYASHLSGNTFQSFFSWSTDGSLVYLSFQEVVTRGKKEYRFVKAFHGTESVTSHYHS